MSIDNHDTKLVLELATYAAKAVTRDVSKEIFDRINHLHETQADRIDKAVDLLTTTAGEVAAMQQRVAHMATEEYARRIAHEMVDECSEAHRSDSRYRRAFGLDKSSLIVSFVALVVATADKVGPLFGRMFTGN